MTHVRRSLTLKWVLTLLLTSLTGVILVGVFANRAVQREYDLLRVDEAKSQFVANVTAYYQTYGTWEDVESVIFDDFKNHDSNARDMMPRVFALADSDGNAVFKFGPLDAGKPVPIILLVEGEPIWVDGVQVGTAVLVEPPPGLDPREQQYLDSITLAVWIGAFGAGAAALLIGLLLSRQFLNPLNDLTHAIKAMRAGDLNQQVKVWTQDELGVLAQTFNQMSAEVHRANQLRKQMTADIAHDLRTPLMVISGYLEALHDGTLKPTAARFEAMQGEVTLLRRLIDDLRTLSLADAGELKLQRQPIQPAELLAQVQQSFEPIATEQHINLKVETDSALPVVLIDRERMAQVLGNLISNALRYTPADGLIRLTARRHENGVRLTVSDTGEGIPPENLPNIFERLYRSDPSRTHSQNESGLGLAIAKSIVEAHGGHITAESTLGVGTRFLITL